MQTDDLGKTHATQPLRYQAEFDNERRWLAWDLLCGRVDRTHPMWDELTGVGVGERELGWFLDHVCPPDVIGINYYLTSERFLDHRLNRYPPDAYGENAFDRYADVEAVRVLASGIDGPSVLLRDAWDRYRLPLAITECHLGCTREEQVRWLRYVWDEAEGVRRKGWTFARSRCGRCSARTTGVVCSRARGTATNRACSTFGRPSLVPPPWHPPLPTSP